ncbi:histidine kinase [Alkaliphilus metalliredigens QYMF]|uniref:histidine kinase n=1 Tax=Alkaliphilus metalliredigens (strain QYMF) TaxID=293826 RepID=A6TTZ4_ALKMQ|nr:PocR ligand-binding domain-containing protein [Alkaliphilus metalliredigens]ABR49662.1 histidine kinase [Alkaliphilus metalliredigens QYMF]
MKKEKPIDYRGIRPVKQYFEWGTVKWLHEPEDVNEGKMMVGHVMFLPNTNQMNHLHTGDEQILYALTGKGIHWVDGKEYPLSSGKVYHIPPYVEHAVKNLSDDPLEMIIVYNASSLNYSEVLPPVEFSKRYAIDNMKEILDLRILQKVQDKFADASQLAIVIEDDKGEIITKPSNPSMLCQIRCSNKEDCRLNSKELSTNRMETKVINCCLDLFRVHTPIFLGDTYIGSISCGPVLLNDPSDTAINTLEKEIEEGLDAKALEDYLNIRRLTKGRLHAIMESLMTMSHFIVETSINNLAQKELHQKTIQMLEENKKKIELENALNAAKMEILQSQLSPHFLFNTLSVIGELAYMQGAKEAAETTFALSKLLRTSLKKSEELIKVREEVDYIKDYLFIQKKRFQDLQTEIDIEKSVLDVEIPFMALQLLVENAITHGFESAGKKVTITIRGRSQGKYVFLRVIDNGSGIKEEVLKRLFLKDSTIKQGTGIGIVNLEERLSYYYGEDFLFNIDSQWGIGTEVMLKIPIERQKKVEI